MNSELYISLTAVVVTGFVCMVGLVRYRRFVVHRSFLAFSSLLLLWALSELVRFVPYAEAWRQVFIKIQPVTWPVAGILFTHLVYTWLGRRKDPIYLIFLSISLVSVPLWITSPWLQLDGAASRWGVLYGPMVLCNLGLPGGAALLMLYGRYRMEEGESVRCRIRSLVVATTALVTMSVVVGVAKAFYLVAPMMVVAAIGTYGSMSYGCSLVRDMTQAASYLFRNAKDGMLVLDKDRHVLQINQAAKSLLGLNGGSVRDQRILPLLKLQEGSSAGQDYEIVVGQGLEAKTLLVTQAAIDNACNQQGILMVVRDITDHKTVDQENKQLTERLYYSQKMEALGRLAGGVAHDFNNLLSAILGYASIIRESLDPSDQLQEDAKELQITARRAASLTRQLLAFSRREANEPEVMDLNEAISDMEKMLRRIIGEDIVLITELVEDPWPVLLDQGQIEQVMVNLVVNARDAMPVGGKLTIETANLEADQAGVLLGYDMQPGRYACLRVQDNGIGIPSDIVEQIFEPFFSSKPFGKGTGLGLSTVYGIVKQVGGEIRVRSKAGEGACFDLFFPTMLDNEAGRSKATVQRPAVSGAETVLLVEDDRTVRSLASRILASKGYTVLEAESGEKAIELVKEHKGPIHIMLTDMIMPGMNGKELADRVLASRADTQVMFMSGYTDDVLAKHGLLDNKLNLIEKPIDADRLLSRLVGMLQTPKG